MKVLIKKIFNLVLNCLLLTGVTMGGKKNKGYYKGGGAKKYKGAELQHGVVGFMFTYVRDRQRGAKAEAYELLNTYAAQFCEAAESSGQVMMCLLSIPY